MMPTAPSLAVPVSPTATKMNTRIGFSIDDLVGKSKNGNNLNNNTKLSSGNIGSRSVTPDSDRGPSPGLPRPQPRRRAPSSSPPPAHSRLISVSSAPGGGIYSQSPQSFASSAVCMGYGEAMSAAVHAAAAAGLGQFYHPGAGDNVSPFYGAHPHHHHPVSATSHLANALDLSSGQAMSVSQLMLAREQYALYPWLLARQHHRLLPHQQRLPGMSQF